MALNTCEMRSNSIKIAFFSQKITKNRATAGGFAPRPPKPLEAGGPAPKPPSVIHLSYTSFLITFPKLDICIFQLLVKDLFLCKILVTCKQATTISDLPSQESFVPQVLSLWKHFYDVFSCDLWFRPPPIKNSGYTNELEIACKKSLKTFFFGERLRLCPWSLALASSILVLGLERFSPRKGCPWPWIFLCPWPWPRALCPQLHLWS